MWSGSRLLTILNRKKMLSDDIMETPLSRCLGTTDLTMLGVGHMVGAGIFVLTGTVVREVAGPATLVSYLMAGIAATLASLCYAEFGARVPKAGSAYTYTYVTMGEFWAFTIGWNIILEHLLGAASVARAWSGSFDAMFNGAIKNGTMEHVGQISVPWMSDYPDFIALLIVIVVMMFVSVGAKISINFNTFFTAINVLVILLIISVGFSLGKGRNWSNDFVPYGYPGVFAGAATCFYAYIGFEGIAVAGEEAKNPAKSIPIATGLAMIVVTVLYIGSTASLTLMVPYDHVVVAAPFPAAFEERGLHWARFVVAVGTLFGITTSLIGSLFSLPRAVYSMASDGLFFWIFSYVHPKTQTPVVAILVFGLTAGLFALLIDIETLVEFLSIGTLLSFTLVAACVIILRYRTADKLQFKLRPEEADADYDDDDDGSLMSDKKGILKTSQSHDDIGKLKKQYLDLPILRNLDHGVAPVVAVIAMAVFIIVFWCVLLKAFWAVQNATWWAIILLLLSSIGMVMSLLVILAHEQNKSFITFQVPLVPYIPALSMFVNIAMMLQLNYLTWIRLVIWLAVGYMIYFAYGVHKSKENRPLASYNQIVNYAGTEYNDPSGSIIKPSETIHQQQPPSHIVDPSTSAENDGL
ncbi:hypothetical protein LSH36_930g00007 [Paralvinella palmiformis]|uniref:Cationic amino acid transporter C-terminal domain-containing protein n=1 Tax=Paralvinella palmiformis TaxID=53620 RepID=A0AAD9MSL9_9ANNE|nr:hypothetical protein LSH36_930g00007 [Paralvinella palmiformis]